MSVPNFRKSYHMGFEKNCRKSRLSKQFDKTGNSVKSIQPKIGTIELSLMSVPNFRKSYHTVLGAAIDSHGTRIIKPTITIGYPNKIRSVGEKLSPDRNVRANQIVKAGFIRCWTDGQQ